MDTDHNTSYTRDTNLDHHNPNSINHPKRKNDLRHTLKLNSNDNHRHRISESVLVLLWNGYVHFPETLGTCYGTDTRKIYIFFQAPRRRSEITTEHYKWNNTNFG